MDLLAKSIKITYSSKVVMRLEIDTRDCCTNPPPQSSRSVKPNVNEVDIVNY